MGHTVIQTDQTPVSAEQLAKAFLSIDRLAPADGAKMARESFGLIIDRLEREEAAQLQRALAAQGIQTRIIDDADLFSMPPVKTTKRIDCEDSHLNVYDALGRPASIPWDQVLVVASGRVNLFETQVQEQERWARPRFGTPGGMAPIPVPVTERSYEGQEVPRLVLDFIVLGEPSRYRAESQELNYAYLEGRLTGNAEGNFAALLSDFVSCASSATLNQGTVALLSDFSGAFIYPSRKAFEREIVWLIWSGTHA